MRAAPTQVFVVNLDLHPDRLAHMQGQLGELPFLRIPAVDGADLSDEPGGLTRFELACLMSHQQVWRRLLASGEERAVVLEDDLHLAPDFPALVRGADWVPPDAHTVKLDTYFQKVMLGPRRPASARRGIARLFSRHESSAAYLVTRAGAERYLALTTPPKLPADYSIFPRNPRRLGLNIYQLDPAVAVQDHLLSREEGGQRFATTIAGSRIARTRRGALGRLGREGERLTEQASDLAERAYVSALHGAREGKVGFESDPLTRRY